MCTLYLKGSIEAWKHEKKRTFNSDIDKGKKYKEITDEFGRKRLVLMDEIYIEDDDQNNQEFQKFKGPNFYRFSRNPAERFVQQTNILQFSNLLNNKEIREDNERLKLIEKNKTRNKRLLQIRSKKLNSI
jgi:flagellar motility protein MotE (MotC chaperone)